MGIVPLAWLPRQGELINEQAGAPGACLSKNDLCKKCPLNGNFFRCFWQLIIQLAQALF